MTGFVALLRLQLLSRLADLKPRNIKANLKEKKAKTIGMLFAYVFLAVYLLGFLIFIENSLLNVLIPAGVPDMLLTVAVMMGMLSTLVLSFFFIMSTLYFGRDTAYLAALPVKSRTVLAAKLTQVWISETGISALFILPACVLYGVRVGADALFYVRMALVWLGIAVLPIVLVTFFSSLLIRFSALWKKREMVATVSGIILLIGYMFLCMNIGSIAGSSDSEETGEALAQFMLSHSARIDAMTQAFPPAGWAAKGLQGDWGQLLLFLAVCAAAMAATVWVIGLVYRKLSLLQTETPTASRKRGAAADRFAMGSVFKACCQRELRQILRVPSYATNTLPTALMPALMTGMMALTVTNLLKQDGETLDVMLQGINPALILPILTAVMAYMAGLNPAVSTGVTREGKGHDVLTALPIPHRTAVLAKLAVGFGLSLVGCLLGSGLIAVLLPRFAVHAVLAFVLCALFCYLTACLALARDVKSPKLTWTTEQEAVKQNMGALWAMLISWGILIALGGVTYLLLTWGVDMYLYAAIMAALLALLAFLAHRHLMKTADTQYCKG